MGILYLLALCISLTGMVVLDRRFGLFFWAAPRRAAVVLALGVAFFVVWDLAGIGLGIFFRGETSFMTGLQVAPELPVEELFFLTLLCYLVMNAYGFISRRWSSLSRQGSRQARSPEAARSPRAARSPGGTA